MPEADPPLAESRGPFFSQRLIRLRWKMIPLRSIRLRRRELRRISIRLFWKRANIRRSKRVALFAFPPKYLADPPIFMADITGKPVVFCVGG